MQATMVAQAKLNNIQALRAIAAVMVMLLHASIRANNLGFVSWAQPFQYIGFAGVDIFFVISGLVMTLTTYSHLGNKGYSLRFIQRRATRIYSNYWVILVLKSGFIWLGWNAMRSGIDLAGTITLYPQDENNLVIAVAWTLMFEMFFYLIFALAILLPRHFFLPFLVSWTVIVLVPNLFIIERANDMPFAPNFYLSPFHLEFIAGCYIGLLVINRIVVYPRLIFLLGAGIFIATAVISRDAPLAEHKDTFIRVMGYGSGAALLLYGAVTAETVGSLKFPGWMTRFGDASYTIYLVHGIFLQASLNLVYMPFLEGTGNIFLQQGFIIIIAAFILAYSLVHYRFIEKPLLNWCNSRFSALVNRS